MPVNNFADRYPGHWLREQFVGIAFSVLTVAVVTVLIAAAQLFVRIEYVTILYLIPVLIAALKWGTIPAVFVAVAGVAAPAFFFYPPIYDFRVHNPDQVIDLVLFVIVALITSQLSIAVRAAKA